MPVDFNPPFYIRSTVAQTLLASSKLGSSGPYSMQQAAREVILRPFGEVRLQGFYSPQSRGSIRGVAMLLHGWEGSANSAYVLRTGEFLYEHGFSVFRLNYRDHGDTHALNPGLFYAVLLDEVFGAVQQVAQYERELPFYLAGFSMGGNFALRVVRKCVDHPIANLRHVLSVSPVLDPARSTQAIDQTPLLRAYFRRKWARSLRRKQACFPSLYKFEDVLQLATLSEMTEALIRRYSDYATSADYFRGYAVLGDALANVNVPLTILTAQDDPIIPVQDFSNLKLSPSTELSIQCYGGHNGFLEPLAGKAWYERLIAEQWGI